MSFLGKEIRLKRLLNENTGHLMAVTVDHPIGRGVLPGLVNILETLKKVVAGGPDSLTMMKGIAQNCFSPYAGKVSLILKTSEFSPYVPTNDTQLADVEEAVRLGADAVSMGVVLGGDFQNEQVWRLGKLTKDAESFGMPVVAHIYPKGEYISKEGHYSVENLQYCVRLGAEMGVDVIKTWYSGSVDSFAKVVAACPTRVVVAGGDDFSDVRAYLQRTRDLMDAGAIGVAYGRGIWEYEDPTKMTKAIGCIVNHNGSVDDALQILES